jgi:hypothetical protein
MNDDVQLSLIMIREIRLVCLEKYEQLHQPGRWIYVCYFIIAIDKNTKKEQIQVQYRNSAKDDLFLESKMFFI